ncbi:MAG: putative ArsR-family transcriptional regulator [Rhodoglobus sp.]|jgi:DNA-binding transcriptional ArsR family regulator|nr:putative ArsR-family transcriptional regulator [Rhodoglobus sp.]
MSATAPAPDDATQQARARALASPLRMRILRLCLHESRTNKELAELLGVNPGSLLHHVRSLVANGFLRAEEPRRGTRGAREVPYRATRRSWGHYVPGVGTLLLETFLQEIEGLPPDALNATRLGLKLSPARREEMLSRFEALFQEYAAAESDPDGDAISLFFVEHPDQQGLARD